jgi:hypothetical protein
MFLSVREWHKGDKEFVTRHFSSVEEEHEIMGSGEKRQKII